MDERGRGSRGAVRRRSIGCRRVGRRRVALPALVGRRRVVTPALVGLVGGVLALTGCTGEGSRPPTPSSSGASVVATSPSATPTSAPTSSPEPSPTPTPTVREADVAVTAVETLVTGLAAPWGLDFLPDGHALVTERGSGRLLVVGADGSVQQVTGQGADEVAAATAAAGEGGLLGVAVLPGATTTSAEIAVYVTTAQDNRVLRATLTGTQLGPTHPILTGIPAGRNHNGGRLAVGPDRMLYVTTGEIYVRGLSQDPASLGGKVLRITPNGGPAPGNPDPSSPVWTMGHRNVQGIGWAPDGRVFASEFGQDTWDELNILVPGANYGWPRVEGTGGAASGFVDPLVVWGTDDASPSGIAVTDEGVYLAGLRGQALWRVPLRGLPAGAAPTDPAGVGAAQVVLSGYGRLRTVVQAPDGTLWVLTNNTDGRGSPGPDDDRLLRVTLA
jgi:glucose/arabinose dehydrogenase